MAVSLSPDGRDPPETPRATCDGTEKQRMVQLSQVSVGNSMLPSGKPLPEKTMEKTQLLMGKLIINGHFQ